MLNLNDHGVDPGLMKPLNVVVDLVGVCAHGGRSTPDSAMPMMPSVESAELSETTALFAPVEIDVPAK